MTPPSVLLAGRVDAFRKAGGDTEQMLQTCAALGRLGVRARVTADLEPGLGEVDLLHVFNWTRIGETAHRLELARRRGVACVLTPIYQDLSEYDRRGRRGAGALAARLLGRGALEQARVLVHAAREAGMWRVAARQLAVGYSALQRLALEAVRAVVFASAGERAAVERETGPLPRARVVPLGISPEFGQAKDQAWHAAHPARDFVLCAARIEDLKNQLGLLEALAGVAVPLVLAGDPNPSHRGYARAVARAVAKRPDTYHLPALSRPLLASAMAAARVHALPSWVENVGLASLEAAAAGAAVVSTNRGHLREYLGDEARYCDPGDPDGLRTALLAALAGGRRDGSRAAIADRFTWDRAALLLRAVYDEALGGPAAQPS